MEAKQYFKKIISKEIMGYDIWKEQVTAFLKNFNFLEIVILILFELFLYIISIGTVSFLNIHGLEMQKFWLQIVIMYNMILNLLSHLSFEV